MISCKSQIKEKPTTTVEKVTEKTQEKISVGANNTALYLTLLKDKNIAVVANQTSVIFKKGGNYTHLVDSLISNEIQIKKVFCT